MNGFDHHVLAFACALATVLLSVNAKWICSRLNLIDIPTERKLHQNATPLLGGIAILAVVVPAGILSVVLTSSDRWVPTLAIWLVCVAAMALVGIADDRHSLSPRARLGLSFLVFALAAAIDPTFNIRVLDFDFPRWSLGLGTWWLAIIFMVICSVGLINAINMADGKNGLVLGLSLGWLGILSIRAPEALLPLIIILASVILVLLVFNLKGKLFLGDGGAYGIACAIGLLAIMTYNSPGEHNIRAISADGLVVLFIVPVADSFRLSYVRWRQGRSPMAADRDHLHHHLQSFFGWPRGLYIYWLIALLPATLLFAFG